MNSNNAYDNILKQFSKSLQQISCCMAGVFAVALMSASVVQAEIVNIAVASDGDVTSSNGSFAVETADTVVTTSNTGALETRTILEFDLSDIPLGANIESATLKLTAEFPFVGSAGDIPLNLFAEVGDGMVEVDDFDSATGNVGSFLISNSPGPSVGDELTFELTSLFALELAALTTDQLTIRLETDSVNSLNFASLESDQGFAPPTLSVTIASAVPEPSGAVILLIGAMA